MGTARDSTEQHSGHLPIPAGIAGEGHGLAQGDGGQAVLTHADRLVLAGRQGQHLKVGTGGQLPGLQLRPRPQPRVQTVPR